MSEKNARNETCRREVRGWLAERPTIAAYAQQICRGLNHGADRSDCTVPEVSEALAFLTSTGHVVEIPNTLGSTRFFQITGAGTLAHEQDHRA